MAAVLYFRPDMAIVYIEDSYILNEAVPIIPRYLLGCIEYTSYTLGLS